VSALQSERVAVDNEPWAFNRELRERGWTDGLPCLPASEDVVEEYLAATRRRADEVIAVLPPRQSACTVEKIAINAAMTGAPREAMDLIIAALQAMVEPDFSLAGINATTASVVPAVVVNGPARVSLNIPYSYSCLGGAVGSGPSIGRAIRLIMRNVAGQVAGTTSQSVFGQPGRVTGIVVGEWEERSPWLPLAERRGVAGDAVTVFGTMGTSNIVDTHQLSAEHLLHVIGGSVAYMGANGAYVSANQFSEVLIAINPVWAEMVGKTFPSIQDVQELIWEKASLPAKELAPATRESVERLGRVQANGRIHQLRSPEHVLIMVCGGIGALHAAMLPGFASEAVTRAVTDGDPSGA
jgi:hypothetical protein